MQWMLYYLFVIAIGIALFKLRKTSWRERRQEETRVRDERAVVRRKLFGERP